MCLVGPTWAKSCLSPLVISSTAVLHHHLCAVEAKICDSVGLGEPKGLPRSCAEGAVPR